MKEQKTFELKDVYLGVPGGKENIWLISLFLFTLFGSFAYDIFTHTYGRSIFYHFKNACLVLVLIVAVLRLFKKEKTKDFARRFLIGVNEEAIFVEIEGKPAFKGLLTDLKAIRTLELSNKKYDVQCKIYLKDQVFVLTSSLNGDNKFLFDSFVLYCERKLKMKIKPVPFSIFTHNWQGIKYVEYYNPENPLKDTSIEKKLS